MSEFVNQSPLRNTCEATDGLTLFRVTSCVDSVHKNQYTNDEFFTASQYIFPWGADLWGVDGGRSGVAPRCARPMPHARKGGEKVTATNGTRIRINVLRINDLRST